jgi:hypothetical protein
LILLTAADMPANQVVHTKLDIISYFIYFRRWPGSSSPRKDYRNIFIRNVSIIGRKNCGSLLFE